MKRVCLITLFLLIFVATFAILHRQLVYGQADNTRIGWLEGRIHTYDGHTTVISVEVMKNGQQVAFTNCDANTDGLYTFQNLSPGVYEIRVMNVPQDNRPQRIWGVMVKPGVRTVLDVQLNEGSSLEEIGQPSVATEPVTIISQKLDHLQAEIDALKNK